MPIYGPDAITFDGVSGDRYWFHEPFAYTGVADIDERLSGFPVAVFLPENRPRHQTPLVIGLQGMSAPYGWNAFIVPTLTHMGIAVALFDTPLAGDRSLVRTFTAGVENEIKPLVDRGIPFDTKLLLQIFKSSALDIARVRDFCRDRYGLSDTRLALFGVSMGVLQAAYAFTADGLGDRLLGVMGHANLQSFAKSWVKPNRKIRFLVGECDRIVNIRDARNCAQKFPDNACYVVPGMGHGQINYGRSFVDHVRYFLATQLGDWQS